MLNTQNASELTVPYTHWWLYGATGAGKTTAAATFPKPLFLVPESEQSITTLAGGDFEYITITAMEGKPNSRGYPMNAALAEIKSQYNAAASFFGKDDAKAAELFPWETIVVESITHYTDMAINELSLKAGNDTFAKWRLLGEHLNRIQIELRGIDAHCVFTSLAEVEKTEDRVLEGRPMVQSKARVKMPSACDVIAYMELKGTKRFTYFTKNGPWIARSRFCGLPDRVENFDFGKIEHLLGAPADE